MSCVKPVTNVKNVASNLPVGARLQNFWQTWLDLGAGPKVVQILKEGYTLPFRIRPKLTRSPPSHKLLWQSPQEPLPAGGITLAYRQKHSGISTKPNISGIFQPTVFSPKAQQQVETYIRSGQIESFPQGGEIQNGDTGKYQNIPPTRGVGHLNRFQRVGTDGHTQGYKDPPIPRRQVGESQIPPGLSPTHSRSSEDMPRTRLAGEFRKIRTGTKTDF